MTVSPRLVPVTGVLSTITKVYDDDPQTAATLLRFSLYDALCEQIEVVRPAVEAQVAKNVAAINRVARTKMLRNHVGKAVNGQDEPEDLEYAQALAVMDTWVSKGLIGSLLRAFNEQHDRDQKGRFIAGSGATGMADHTLAANQSIGENDSNNTRQRQGQPSDSRAGAVNMLQLATGASTNQASRASRGIFNDQGDVRSDNNLAAQWNGPTEGTQRQAYNRLQATGSALSSMSTPGSQAHTLGTMATFAGQLGPEAEKVLGPSVRRTAYRYRGTQRRPDKGLTDDMENITNIAEVYSGRVNEPGSTASGAKAAARLANVTNAARRPGAPTPKQDDVVAGVAAFYRDSHLSPDQTALRMRGDTAVAHLLGVGKGPSGSRLPNLKLAALSIASGELPPSEGIMIDQNGKVSTQSIGYNGDHYLPFDLSNLKGMEGGQYVRTRATGGPTGEDVYTGLLSGARQMQVVSNSGVFTLEFDPDFRGQRRYNDKAHRMIERYTSILGAIDSKDSELFVSDLDEGVKAGIRQEASRVARTDQEFDQFVAARTDEKRLEARGGTQSVEDIREMASNKAQTALATRMANGSPMSRQQQARYADDLTNEYIDEAFDTGAAAPAVQRMRLNGEGYARALSALQQEFPYYIRSVDYQTVDEWLGDRNMAGAGGERVRHNRGGDLGFTQAGQTNARSTLGTEKKPATGFRSARAVPTSAKTSRTTTATSEGQTNAGSDVRVPGSGAGAGDTGAQSASSARPDPDAVAVADLGADPNYKIKLGQALSPAIAAMAQAYPAGKDAPGADFDRDTITNPTEWGSIFAQQIVQKSPTRAGAAAVEWLMDPSRTESEKSLFTQALNNAATEDWGYADESAAKIQAPAKAALAAVTNHLEISEPFDSRDLQTVIAEGFDSGKPPAVAGIPSLGSTDRDFAIYQSNQRPELRSMIDDYAVAGPEDVESQVESQRAVTANTAKKSPTEIQAEKAELNNRITAWAFVTARAASTKLRSALGKDDASPKAPAPAAPATPPHPPKPVGKSLNQPEFDPSYVQMVLRALSG